MVTIPRPLPGTVAALHPPPPLVEEAVALIEEGVDPLAAAQRLATRAEAVELRSAHRWWVRRVPRQSWDDHHAGAVLRALEMALARTNGLVTARSDGSDFGPRTPR